MTLWVLEIVWFQSYLEIAWEPRHLGLSHVALSLFSMLLAVVFIWASLAAGSALKYAYFTIFSLALFVEYNYHTFFSRFSTARDIIAGLTPLDTDIGHDAILAYSNPLVIVPLMLYAGLLFISNRNNHNNHDQQARMRSISKDFLRLALLLLCTLTWYSSLYAFNSAKFNMVSFSNFFHTTTFAAWDVLTAYNGPREKLTLQSSTHPNQNIIFIVDESVRADHLSVNGYQRETTPYLTELQQQGLLYNWGLGLAAEDCSLDSNNLLLSGINQLPAHEGLIRKKPSIFQYAQAMGYKTYHLNASSNQFWIGTADDLNYIDEWWPRSAFESQPRFDVDFKLAQQTSNIVQRSLGNFIWINKRGLHFNYNSHYPPTATLWKPVSSTRFDPNQRAELINAYDNAIRYNVNTFFEHLLKTNPAILEQTTILYTADHGQTLSERGETWTHCIGTPPELLVPIFMISAKPYRLKMQKRATHFNIFATLLDLMAFPRDQQRYPYAPSLLESKN